MFQGDYNKIRGLRVTINDAKFLHQETFDLVNEKGVYLECFFPNFS